MSSSRLFKLGLFFLAAFGMLAYFTLFLYDQQWFGDQTVFRVEFPEANGLRVGDGVRVSGMRIGRVTRMGFDPNESFMSFEHFYGQNFWRLVYLQQEVAKLAETAIKYPPLQASASFNLDAVKKKVKEAQGAHGQ